MAKKKAAMEELEEAMESLEEASASLPPPNLSLGSDLADIHISGTPGAAVSPGMILWLHGNSGSGKSFHAKLLMAEAANNPFYDEHRLVVFDGEYGSNFNNSEFFGRKMAERVEPMEAKSLDHLYDAIEKLAEKPVVIIVDSWDAWLPMSALTKIDEDMVKREKDKDPEGSYKMEQGKIHSERLRKLMPKLAKSNSILIGLSQHRDNIERANPYSPKDKTSGGRALKFWCHLELEMSIAEQIKKEVNGKKVSIGEEIQVTVRKNRVNGLRLAFREHFYPTFGIDNLGTTIAWLQENKYLTNPGGRYKTSFTGEAGYYLEDFIAKIQDENLENDLLGLLKSAYSDYMEQLDVSKNRKRKYE